MKRKNDENCVVANMFTVFWFNKQNEFETIQNTMSWSRVFGGLTDRVLEPTPASDPRYKVQIIGKRR